MTKKKVNSISRRKFLKLTAVLTGSVIVAANNFSFSNSLKGKEINKTIRLNPAFRIKNISSKEIELYTHHHDGSLLTHHFFEFEADLIRQIENGNSFSKLNLNLAKIYKMPESICKEKLITSLKELENKNLVYYGKKMLVKISETKSGN